MLTYTTFESVLKNLKQFGHKYNRIAEIRHPRKNTKIKLDVFNRNSKFECFIIKEFLFDSTSSAFFSASSVCILLSTEVLFLSSDSSSSFFLVVSSCINFSFSISHHGHHQGIVCETVVELPGNKLPGLYLIVLLILFTM